MVRIDGLLHLLINGRYIGVITHLLTIDPNFLGYPSGCLTKPSLDCQRDIQVGV